MKFKFSLITLFIIAFFFACTDNTENLTGPDPDDDNNGNDNDPIENVSYADQVQPIFNNSCGGSGCHTDGGSANGVRLSNYSQTINSVGASYGTDIVVAGDASASPLFDKIQSSPDRGSRMPLGRSPLSSTQIETIRVWINEGAENN